ncbi:MAG: chemotaxis protein CheY [Verrucomicrobiales bacterium]|nr:chemotaxis protein CheY [Verrucomicrobiales bacterium]
MSPAMLRALTRLLRGEGFEVCAHSSAVGFLEAWQPEGTACLVLDVGMPGMDGLDLQRRLLFRGTALPIVFLTGCGDIP